MLSAAAEPERSRALSICVVMRLNKLGRVADLAVVALSSVGREVEVLVGFVSSGPAFADVVASPAMVCARVMERRVGADMVCCDEVCGPVLAFAFKSGVAEDDGSTVGAGTSRLEWSALVDCMLRERVVCRCQDAQVRLSVCGLCSRARSCALFPARARACERSSGGELQARESSHKAAII